MYHDQGQIATKLKGFNRGVTVTAGLETIFTTPAHGTAFDIVGQGVATTGALEQAVRLAARLCAGRKAARWAILSMHAADETLTDYVAGFVTAKTGARHPERCRASRQALGARRHRTRARGRGF